MSEDENINEDGREIDGRFLNKNRIWTLRSSHGRKRIFETPSIMWDAVCEFFQWCEDNPLYEHDFVGSGAREVYKAKMRPFTIQALCLFLGVNTVYFNQFETNNNKKIAELTEGKQTKEVKKELSERSDFSKIIHDIREIIYNQKFIGAASGFLNQSIIARDLGLVDKQENDVKGGLDISGNIDITYK